MSSYECQAMHIHSYTKTGSQFHFHITQISLLTLVLNSSFYVHCSLQRQPVRPSVPLYVSPFVRPSLCPSVHRLVGSLLCTCHLQLKGLFLEAPENHSAQFQRNSLLFWKVSPQRLEKEKEEDEMEEEEVEADCRRGRQKRGR